ncbi:MAG: hypothetical protein J0L75_14155 [Spirochaetes bacterium]|nr:hypothetical protein [Spirochaetota bacterium]
MSVSLRFRLLIMGACLASGSWALGGNWRAVTPVVETRYRPNPGKGWILYGDPASRRFTNLPAEAWAIGSIGYMRFNWAELESAPGVTQWGIVERAISECRAHGLPFAFRVFCANYFGKGRSSKATPDWVFAKGARGVGEEGASRVPVWDDPVFLQCIQAFHRALAKRWDGDPSIAFIDLGSYGNWGENHLSTLSAFSAPIDSKTFLESHALPFKAAFQRTPVAVCSKDDDSKNLRFLDENPEVLEATSVRLAAAGFWLRWDGAVCGVSPARPLRHAAVGTPKILEWCFTYEETLRLVRGWKDRLSQDLAESGASYLGLGLWRGDAASILAAEGPLVEAAGRRLGYEFIVRNIALEPGRANVSPRALRVSIEATGLAPCPPAFRLSLASLDDSGLVLGRIPVDGVRPNEWEPGKTVEVRLDVPSPPPAGARRIALGFYSSGTSPEPDVRFFNKYPEGSLWFPLAEFL